MTDQGGEDILLVTNVGPTILRSYFAPLAALDGVRRLTIVRDRGFVPFASNVEWRDSSGGTKSFARVMIRAARVVVTVARRRPTSIMVMHWFPDGFYIYPIARVFRIPVIAHIIGGKAEIDAGARKIALSRAPAMVKRTAQAVTRTLLNRIGALTFTGTSTLRHFRELGVRSPSLHVLYPLVPYDEAVVPLAARTADIVYVGRIDADKRFDRFLRVVAALARDRAELRVTVCGLSAADVLADDATRCVVMPDSARITYLGHVPDVRPHLRAARIFVLSSDSEGLSLAMLEAMGCGTVPVVTAVGDIGSALDECGAGIAVRLVSDEDANVASVASAAASVLADRDAWARHSSRAHAHIRDRHSLQATQARWGAVIGREAPQTGTEYATVNGGSA